jgi:hypothetical protein
MMDLEDRIKEHVLQGLVEHMHDKMGDGLADKFKAPLEVTVGADSADGLAKGLDHAKDLADMAPDDDDKSEDMGLLGSLLDDDDDDKMKG